MSSIRSAPELPSETVPVLASSREGCSGETILLVEDEDFVRQVTGEVLTFAGYQVICARHAAEAVRLFRQREKEVQLLLTDVVLPGRNGHDLARDLRTLRPGLKTMFISGYPDTETSKRRLQGSGVIYLPKPFSVESLMQAVHRILTEEDTGKSAKARRAATGE